MEANTSFDEIKVVLRQIAESQKETDRITKENAKLIGGLGDKFGSFTEGMAFPSMEKTLRKQFGMETISTRVRTRKEGKTQEIDVLGYANGTVNTVVIVEVKSNLRERDIDQIKDMIDNFAYFHPEHQGKKMLCLVAYVEASKEAKAALTKMGVMLARINDDVVELANPEGFTPRDFSQPVAAI
ncbi:hypothetical protein [Spirosoma areae]